MAPKTIKMKSLTITLFFLLFLSPLTLFAQDFWEQLPFPDTARIWCFDVNSQNEIFVGTGGDNTHGCIYKSSDNGQSWSVFYDFNGELVSRLGISDSDIIYVSKDAQSFVYSDNNGESWVDIELPSYAHFGINEILCSGNDTVYLAFWEEDGGLLIRTTDNGVSWDSLFRTENHSSEYIGDILVDKNNEIYLGLGAYFPNMGGVYKSTDFGQNWEFIGLLNRNISGLIKNSDNDLFASVRGAVSGYYKGIYVLRNGAVEWEPLLTGKSVEDILITENEHIYFSSSWPPGIGRSINNGENFEWLLDGLEGASIGEIMIDKEDYIYAITPSIDDYIFRSINSTVGFNLFDKDTFNIGINISPNPCQNELKISFSNNPDGNEKIIVNIYSITGELMRNLAITTNSGQCNIATDQLKCGVYFLHIVSSNNNFIEKFIKQ